MSEHMFTSVYERLQNPMAAYVRAFHLFHTFTRARMRTIRYSRPKPSAYWRYRLLAYLIIVWRYTYARYAYTRVCKPSNNQAKKHFLVKSTRPVVRLRDKRQE